MPRKQLYLVLIIAFFVGALGSIVFQRGIFPSLSVLPGLSFLRNFSTDAPIIITRTEEIHLNEGANIIELTKQAQGFTVSIFSLDNKNLGNGIILTSDGLIFTSKEVVSNLSEVRVVLNDGKVYPGLIRAMDPRTEIAVLTIPANNLTVASFADASNLVTAQRVLALGKTNQAFTRRFASGLVTKTVRNEVNNGITYSTESFNQTISTDADINADFVGGPIINLEGRVIGMVVNSNSKILISETIRSALKPYLEQGKIVRPYIGMRYQIMTKAESALANTQPGALVVDIEKGSPAEISGLMKNDLILEVNGEKLEDSSLEIILAKSSAKEFKVEVLRNNSRAQLTLIPEIK